MNELPDPCKYGGPSGSVRACKDDGTPWKPDHVSRRFKAIAREAGLPAIKLHEGRHSAASLARDAEVDPEIRRKTLGHADQAMTSHYAKPRVLHQMGEKSQVAC